MSNNSIFKYWQTVDYKQKALAVHAYNETSTLSIFMSQSTIERTSIEGYTCSLYECKKILLSASQWVK